MSFWNEKNKKILALVLLVLAISGIILFWVEVYVFPDDDRYINSAGEIIGKKWYEKLIFPFTFTYISNFMAIIFALNLLLNFFKNQKIKKRFEILTAVNLLITFLVYWTVLFPSSAPRSPLGWVNNMIIHLIVPLFMIVIFILENILRKNDVYFSWWKDSLWNLIFPVCYLALATIIYAALNFDTGGAVYGFLDFAHQSVLKSLIFVFGIAIAYYFFTAGFIFLSNQKIKNKT